ncbi:thymidine phosphorylase, partial [Escherichia coli]|nr:thymidine phosphorylase [Escherichia coli]
VINGQHRVLAILHRVDSDWLHHDEIALSDAAWKVLKVHEGVPLRVRHPQMLESLRHLRAKVYGARLDYGAFHALMQDIAA